MTRRHSDNRPGSLKALEEADRNQLNGWCVAEFGHTPAPRASLAWMRQNLAWSLQAREKGMPPANRREQLIRGLSRQLNGKTKGQVPYRPGTRLVREWQGQVYEVTVLEDGYALNGEIYPNLSRIATAITGTKWSGPRFFGLKGEKDGTN